MKFLAIIRAQCATFYNAYLARLNHHYSFLTPKQKLIAKGVATVGGVVLLLFFICWAISLLVGHKPLVPNPMVIRHGNRIEIPPGSPMRAQIEFKTVELSAAPHVLSFPGWVEAIPSNQVSILPPLTGRLVSLSVEIGDEVKAGQVLAIISSPDFAQAKSDYQKALSEYGLTQAILKRAKAVNQVGGNSIQVVQQAKNDALQAESELNRAKERLNILQMRLRSVGNSSSQVARPTKRQELNGQQTQIIEKKSTQKPAANLAEEAIFDQAKASLDDPNSGFITLRSPLSGRVTSLNYGLGSYINDTTAALMSVVNLDKVWVTASIPESMLPQIHKGQPVRVMFLAYPNEPYSGYIRFVDAQLNADTRRNQTRIVLSNSDGRLQPNMYANIDVRVKELSQIMIPLSSVFMNNESIVVYVESSPWVCQSRVIELGEEDGDSVRVVSGLKPGEHIVTSGGVLINDK